MSRVTNCDSSRKWWSFYTSLSTKRSRIAINNITQDRFFHHFGRGQQRVALALSSCHVTCRPQPAELPNISSKAVVKRKIEIENLYSHRIQERPRRYLNHMFLPRFDFLRRPSRRAEPRQSPKDREWGLSAFLQDCNAEAEKRVTSPGDELHHHRCRNSR